MTDHHVSQPSWDVLTRCLDAALSNDWWTLELEWSTGIERHNPGLSKSCGGLLGHVIGEYSETTNTTMGPLEIADLAEHAWNFSKHWYHIPETEFEKDLRALITKDYTQLGQYAGAHLLIVVATLLYEGRVAPEVIEFARASLVTPSM
jgi:hypothetical protein